MVDTEAATTGGTGQRVLAVLLLLVAGVMSLPISATFLDGEGNENWIVPAQLDDRDGGGGGTPVGEAQVGERVRPLRRLGEEVGGPLAHRGDHAGLDGRGVDGQVGRGRRIEREQAEVDEERERLVVRTSLDDARVVGTDRTFQDDLLEQVTCIALQETTMGCAVLRRGHVSDYSQTCNDGHRSFGYEPTTRTAVPTLRSPRHHRSGRYQRPQYLESCVER